MTANPLVAHPAHGGPGAWAGIALAEDVEQIVQGVQNGSWIDGALGAVSAGLDALAFVSDPIGGLLQYGVAWLIEHVKPLSEALDWLAGDPGQIAAQAQTWRNISGSLSDDADGLGQAVRHDLSEWVGSAADAYRSHAGQRADTLRILGGASAGMALMVEGAGMLIGTVRIMVRDAIATLVSRLAVYAGEVAGSFGLATPLVVEQVSTLCASWAAKIGRWLKQLLSSLRRLGFAMDELSGCVRALRRSDVADETADLMGRRSDWAGRNPGEHPQEPSRPADSHLPSGDPVYYRPNSTAVGYDSQTVTNFDRVRPEPGYHDVVVHGERNGLFRPGVIGEDGADYPANYTHPNQIADAVRGNPAYTGGPVRLISCHSGTVDPGAGAIPAGQEVANALGVPVKAPTDAVGVNRYGSAQQVPRIRDGGTWVTFYPQTAD
ncbi:hypothetical protein COUCH_16855 [Couchioplanes caeruleus]|uniref:WXG100 family type VII secretion target n=1 Tax=Couchioplanes caeruleus TaxID=56438 RepID=UPI0020BE70DB|nr:hypothetical protein [Couchioplanes caeruleus]UQU67840.1 hypothetical protein COUCH_16855 [Couchioplanes caeruleus]